MPQGLLKRNPALTKEQFSEHYFKNHAAIVVPMFLHGGVKDYVQTHGPFTLVDPNTKLDIDLEDWDAAALIPPGDITKLFDGQPQWKQDYYREVVLVDERRFLVSEATKHIYELPPNTVLGEKKVVIQDGKCMIDVPENVWAVWREYEASAEDQKK